VTASVCLKETTRAGIAFSIFSRTELIKRGSVATFDQARLRICRTSCCCVAISIIGEISSRLRISEAPFFWLEKVSRVCKINIVLSSELRRMLEIAALNHAVNIPLN
jgi:hypothetical protein